MYNVYLVSSEINNKKVYKIGYTRRNVDKRIQEFKTANASELEIVYIFNSKWGTKIERGLHSHFKKNKIDGEWFNLNESEVNDFSNVCKKIHNNFEMLDKYNTYIIDRGGYQK